MTGNYSLSTRQEVADIIGGLRVDRAAAVVTAATVALFNIVGGRVLLTGFIGEVASDMDATGCTLRIQALTTDATAVQTFLTSAVTDCANDTASVMYTLPAAVASDLVKSTGTSAAVTTTQVPIVLKTGALNLIGGGASVGTIKWSAFYVPLDDGAYMEAA